MNLRNFCADKSIPNESRSNIAPELLMALNLIFATIVVSFGRYQISALLPFVIYPLYLAGLSKISASNFLAKTFPALPFIIFIGLSNIFFDTRTVILFNREISAGWISFLSLAIKLLLTVAACVASAELLGFDRLCAGLATLGIGEVLTTQLFLLNRYIRLLPEEAKNITRARVFRGGKITLKEAGNICGPLLLRSIARAKRVYNALLCRNFTSMVSGEQKNKKSYGRGEKIFVLLWTLFFITCRAVNLSGKFEELISKWLL